MGSGDKRKFHIMKWSEVVKPKSSGRPGLGAYPLRTKPHMPNGGGGLVLKGRHCGGWSYLLNMVRIREVGFLEVSLEL